MTGLLCDTGDFLRFRMVSDVKNGHQVETVLIAVELNWGHLDDCMLPEPQSYCCGSFLYLKLLKD